MASRFALCHSTCHQSGTGVKNRASFGFLPVLLSLSIIFLLHLCLHYYRRLNGQQSRYELDRVRCPVGHESSFLGAFAKLRKATISFVTYVCLSVRPSAWNNSAPTGRVLITFDISDVFQNLSRKFKFH
jgi:hypothetical protein